MAPINPGGAMWAIATRLATLDTNGFPAAGSPTFTTTSLVKATLTPVTEAGDDIVVKNAAGDIGVMGRHGDMVKYGTAAIEFATPDAQLEGLLAGGNIYTASGAALGLPTGLTVTAQITLGTLAAGTYTYRASQFNQYGETLAEAEVSGTVASGVTGAIVISGVVMAAGATGVRIYGRSQGVEQLLGQYASIGTQATSAASGTGTVTSLTVTALTAPIPAGYTFQISGDTNTTKIVFTATLGAGVGSTSVAVTASQSVTLTIAAAAIIPVFVDTGAVTPAGAVPSSDLTAGPGVGVGYQAPLLGIVGNANGVSLEFWQKRMFLGQQATDYPYWRYIIPMAKNFHIMPRDVTNANLATVYEGQAFQNPNWGSGPVGDFQFDSTRWYQRVMCGAQMVPAAGFASVPAAY